MSAIFYQQNDIEDVIAEVVGRMRVSSIITSATENVIGDGYSNYTITHEPYTYITDNVEYITEYGIPNRSVLELANNNLVQLINDGNIQQSAKATNVDKSLGVFTVKLPSGLDVNLFETWERLEPFYDFGHLKELANKLTAKDCKMRFPLIWLVEDLVGESDARTYDLYSNLKIRIVHYSELSDYSDERESKVFDPVLTPLRLSFIDMLAVSNDLFNFPRDYETQRVRHTFSKAYLFGSEFNVSNGKNKNKFSDNTDAIELTIKQLRVTNRAFNRCP